MVLCTCAHRKESFRSMFFGSIDCRITWALRLSFGIGLPPIVVIGYCKCFAGIDYRGNISLFGGIVLFLTECWNSVTFLVCFWFLLFSFSFFASNVSVGISKGLRPSGVEFSYSFRSASLSSWFDERNDLIYFCPEQWLHSKTVCLSELAKSQNPLWTHPWAFCLQCYSFYLEAYCKALQIWVVFHIRTLDLSTFIL